MEAPEYLPYKIGNMCQHGPSKTSTNYVDVACSNKQDTYHRVSQAGKMCNKCATLIMNLVNSVEYCVCCSEELETLVNDAWICTHRNRDYDEIEIKCVKNSKEIHEVPLKQKVCKNCFEKIRAAFMFSNVCAVCEEKEAEILENVEKTITKPSYYYFEQIIQQMKSKSFSPSQAKQEIEHYCLALPITEISSVFQAESQELGPNLPEYHQSKRYQLYPKCPTHRNEPIHLCNNCLVSILNIDQCPYGCSYPKKENKGVKVSPPVVNQTGFLSLYPKQTKEYEYVEYFYIRHIEESGKLDKWEGSLKKVKYSGTDKIAEKFSLYAASIQIDKFSFLYCGGLRGQHLSNVKTTNSAFIVHISENLKTFTIEEVAAMEQPRASHGLALNENYVYAIGGFAKESSQVLSSCERFNLSTKKWETITPLTIERSKPNVLAHQGNIYVIGGISANSEIWNSSFEKYNSDKNIWENVNYQGFDTPFMTGATALSQTYGLPKTDNIILIGGSNYETSTYLLQEIFVNEKGYSISSDVDQKLSFSRESAALALMKTENPNEFTAIILGGIQEHESFLSFDAIRLKVTNNQATPFFIYDDVNIGSYRLLLRESNQSAYTYMTDKLLEQGLLSKNKLAKEGDHKDESNMHLIEKMWYGIGKCLVGFSPF